MFWIHYFETLPSAIYCAVNEMGLRFKLIVEQIITYTNSRVVFDVFCLQETPDGIIFNGITQKCEVDALAAHLTDKPACTNTDKSC